MTNPDDDDAVAPADHRALWRGRPVAMLLFLAAWSGLLGCWAMGLTPTGEWPSPPVEEPRQPSGEAWWSRLRWAMALPALLTLASLTVWLRRPRSAGGPVDGAAQRTHDRLS